MKNKSLLPMFFDISRPTREIAPEIARYVNTARDGRKQFILLLRRGQWEVHSPSTTLGSELLEREVENLVGVYCRTDTDVEDYIYDDMKCFASKWEDVEAGELVG